LSVSGSTAVTVPALCRRVDLLLVRVVAAAVVLVAVVRWASRLELPSFEHRLLRRSGGRRRGRPPGWLERQPATRHIPGGRGGADGAEEYCPRLTTDEARDSGEPRDSGDSRETGEGSGRAECVVCRHRSRPAAPRLGRRRRVRADIRPERCETAVNRIQRNLWWLLLSQAATWIVSVATLLIAPRVLGDDAFGQLIFVIVYISFFDLIATMGTNTFLVKAIAREPGNAGRYLVNAVVMKLVMTIVLIAVALGLGALMYLPATTMQLIGAYSIGLLLTIVGGTIGAALTGLQMMGGLARWNMIQGYVGGLLSLAILVNHGSLIAYALVLNASFVISIPPNLRRLWPHLQGERRLDIKMWPEILKGGFPFFILAALLVVYGTIDVPILQALTGSEEVGWYAVAYQWVSMGAFFAVIVANAYFPALSAEGVKTNRAFASLANRALRLAVLVATPAAIGIALVADPFLTLVYSGRFHQAIPLLRILALHIPIVSVDIILGSVAMASDRQRQWVMVSVAAAVFNPLLNLAAVPEAERLFHNGAIGAAIVTVLTELILMAGALARVVLASLAMVPVVLALSSAPLPVQVLAGVVTYALASVALRTISIEPGWRWVAERSRRIVLRTSLPPGRPSRR
jgi:O-antigen/teichoic acid export membrane protein